MQNEDLRKAELWDQLEREERDLAMASGGTWPEEARQQLVEWSEQTRLLSWVLNVDEALTPMWLMPKPEADLLALSLGESDQVRCSWEIETERDIALGYLVMATKELEKRGLVQAEKGPSVEEVSLVVGTKVISELEDDELRLLAQTAFARAKYADYLKTILEQDRVILLHDHRLFENY